MINGSVELIYRVDGFYGLGYLLRRSFYEKYMKNSFKECCHKRYAYFLKVQFYAMKDSFCNFRVWEKWTFSGSSSFLMPDVSRIFRRPIDGNQRNKKYVETLFNRKRKTSL